MGERTRRHAQRPKDTAHATTPTRTQDSDDEDRPPGPSNPVLDLQATAGNRAVTQLIAQRDPGDTTPLVTVPTAAEAADNLLAAEAWLKYVSLLGNAPAPGKALNAEYRSKLAVIQAAVGGPGPIPAAELAGTTMALGAAAGTVARTIVERMRAERKMLLPKTPTDAYDIIELALEQGDTNRKNGEQPTDQRDYAIVLLSLHSSAEEEIRDATAAGYQIPKALAELPSEAMAMLKEAQEGYKNGAPLKGAPISPLQQMDLEAFGQYASETINAVRGPRVGDIARARKAEAELLWEKGVDELAKLRVLLADKRRSAFMAGDTDALDDVSEALGAVAGAIEDTRAAAAIITDRVDQLNAAVSMVSKSGKGPISIPDMPSGVTNLADKLVSAHEKLRLILDVLDLLKPQKTRMDEGLTYLKGTDMALKSFAGKSPNPFVAVYVNGYLSPGIESCVASLGQIADIISKSNRAAIEQGQAALITNWNTEPGGEAMYLFIAAVYRMGGAASLSDEAWRYFADHRGDFSKAVGAEMPQSRALVPSWASANRRQLWESLYGSTRPPN